MSGVAATARLARVTAWPPVASSTSRAPTTVSPPTSSARASRGSRRSCGHAGVPRRGGGCGRGGGGEPATAGPRPHRPAAGHHRPADARWTSTRRCTSCATATGTPSTTRSPTSRRSSRPGDPIDLEANKRGQTLYGADSKVPLHPPSLSEGAASLLPDQVCPALLWTIKVDDDRRGHRRERRARAGPVHGQARLRRRPAPIDDGTADEPLMLLKEVGELRLAREAARGGVSLPLPEQEVAIEGDRWEPGVPRPAADRAVERPDLAAHRHGRRVADGLRPRRAAAHPAAARPARRPAPAPHRAGARHRLAGRDALPRLHPLARPDASRPTPRWSPRAPGCCAAAGTSGSSARCPTSRSTRRWRRSTPT